jgi:hypothetical protein
MQEIIINMENNIESEYIFNFEKKKIFLLFVFFFYIEAYI